MDIRCRGSIDLSGVPQRSDLPVHSDVSSSLALPGIRDELQLSCQPLSEDTPEIDTGPVIVDIETASARSYCGVAAAQTVRNTPVGGSRQFSRGSRPKLRLMSLRRQPCQGVPPQRRSYVSQRPWRRLPRSQPQWTALKPAVRIAAAPR